MNGINVGRVTVIVKDTLHTSLLPVLSFDLMKVYVSETRAEREETTTVGVKREERKVMNIQREL